LEETRTRVAEEIAADRTALDALTQQVISAGLATWAGGGGGSLILRGQSRLLQNLDQAAQVQEIQRLFERLEAQETMLRLLELAQRGEGVQIFIGAESGLFDSAGLSVVVAPFRNGQEKIVGAIGVIGPTRINYGRVIPVVDYTARVIGRLLG
jgi:heat-inducible transcriptional repressor